MRTCTHSMHMRVDLSATVLCAVLCWGAYYVPLGPLVFFNNFFFFSFFFGGGVEYNKKSRHRGRGGEGGGRDPLSRRALRPGGQWQFVAIIASDDRCIRSDG